MTEHLTALNIRLAHEKARLAEAKTAKEREIRSVWIKQIEKEIDEEIKFLGIQPVDADIEAMTDDELLEMLAA